MENKKIVNSERTRDEMIDNVYRLFDQHKFVTFEWSTDAACGLPQMALFHIWLRQYAAHILRISKHDVTEPIVEGMKKNVKKQYYVETSARFIVQQIVDPWAPDRIKLAYTSCAKWKRGEMYQVMNWLQMKAAEDGLVLESKGEYKDIQS